MYNWKKEDFIRLASGQNLGKKYNVFMDRVYLDWAATAPADIEIQRTALETSFVYPGNPSSVHTEGKRARQKLEELRAELAGMLNWPTGGICFTSGGTESNNIIIYSMLRKKGRIKILSSGIEHPSISESLKAYPSGDIRFLSSMKDGMVSPVSLENELKGTKLLTVMYTNNEIGTVQDINGIASLKAPGTHFHCDIVQALGKVPLRLDGIDSASISAHKLGGPKGCGLLLFRNGFEPLYKGGGQESGIRPGTESIFNAMCMMETVRKALDGLHESIAHGKYIKRYLLEELKKTEGVSLIPDGDVEELLSDKYSPFILRCSIPPLPGEVIVRMMDDNGISVSTGSACSSRKKGRNEVLSVIGIDEKTAESSIRISWGRSTRLADVQYLIKVLRDKILPAAAVIR